MSSSPLGHLPDRESKIPATAVKVTPQTDAHPAKLHSADWEQPVPLSQLISTAGAEGSAFIMPDRRTLYSFFTPDVSIPGREAALGRCYGHLRLATRCRSMDEIGTPCPSGAGQACTGWSRLCAGQHQLQLRLPRGMPPIQRPRGRPFLPWRVTSTLASVGLSGWARRM
jgi:hypothetical protein